MKRILLVLLLVFGVWSVSAEPAAATGLPAPVDLGGWAWSSTIGWISFNCADTSSCAADGGFDYAVTIDHVTGDLTGYAWSSNIGWIKFGGLSNFPTGGGTDAVDARVTGVDPNFTLEGWARACAATDDGNPATAAGDCTSMNTDPQSGGWDGWISLKGTGYGVTTDSSGGSGFAWGDLVVGWVDFSGLQFGAVPTSPQVSLTANPGAVSSPGDTTTLEYSIANADSCTASNDQGAADWDASTVVNSADGTWTETVTVNAETEYTLTCTNSNGNTSDSVTVTLGAVSTVDLTPITISASDCEVTDLVGGAPATTGTCPPIPVQMDVRNDSLRPLVAAVDGPFPYEFAYRELPSGAWVVADTGAHNSDVSDGGTFTVNGTVTLPDFSDYEVRGSIDGKSLTTSLTRDPYSDPAPPEGPTITIGLGYGTVSLSTGGLDFVRRGTEVPVTWVVDSSLPLVCTVRGPGISVSFNHFPAVMGTNVTDNALSPEMSSELRNLATFEIACDPQAVNSFTPPPGLEYVASESVEVIPGYQEI